VQGDIRQPLTSPASVRPIVGEPAGAWSDADRPIMTLAVWAGPAATVFAILGLVVVGGFVPAQDPSASGAEIARFYGENATQIRVGMILAMVAFTLFVPFGIAIALQTRRTEQRPVLTYMQIACVAIAALEGVLSCVIWAAAAFRPDVIDPDITRALNDLGWFAFLFDVAPFSLWLFAIAIAILRDTRAVPVLPRWLGYFNLFAAVAIEPACMMAFFKTGPFGYDGLLALYLPFCMFFAWILVMTVALIGAVKRERPEPLTPLA